jgi:tetratricopeptide (TPR) repeat protein
VRSLLAGCSGNPLLVVETVSSLCDRGAIVARDGVAVRGANEPADLPVSLHETVRRRMVPLDGEIRAVAAVAALLGARFTLADLAAVTGRSPTEIYAHVQELIDARLFVDDGDALAFRHDLVRDAVATLLPASVRAELHQAIADGLRAAGAPVVRVAEHLALAGPTGAPETIALLRRAASEVVTRDPSAATRLLRRAVEQCAASDPTRDEVMTELVDALAWSGHTAEAQTIASEALTRPLPPDIEEQLRSSLGRSLLLLGRPQESIEQAERVVRLRESIGRSSAWAQAECAICRLFAVDLDAALEQAEVAAAAAEHDGDAMAAILALCVESFARNSVGDTATAVERGDTAVRLADRTPGGEGHRLHPHLFRGVALQTIGNHEAAATSFREGRARGEALGAPWAFPIYHFVTGLAHWDAGRWDDVLAEVNAGIAFGE